MRLSSGQRGADHASTTSPAHKSLHATYHPPDARPSHYPSVGYERRRDGLQRRGVANASRRMNVDREDERAHATENAPTPIRNRAPGAPGGKWWLLLAGTLTLLASRLLPIAPLVAWQRSDLSVHATLYRSPLRLALSPVTSTLEGLSLLPAADHVAVVASILLLVAVYGAARTVPAGATAWPARLRGCLWYVGAGAFAIGSVYVAGALVAWPMAQLRLENADELAVDFHSHTLRSHDGRWDFTLERNRAWHADGGFDVAYVTDHADSAAVREWPVEREAPILLEGAEFCSDGVHLVRLGRADDSTSVLILTTPFPEQSMARMQATGTRVAGVEAADASPRGLQWLTEPPAQLAEAVANPTLVPVSSSNLHGWGRTVAAWTVLRLPGWRANSPEELDQRIRALLRSGDHANVRIILRNSQRLAAGAHAVRALALPALAWSVLRTLDNREVAVWLAWLWAPSALSLLLSFVGLPPRVRVRTAARAHALAYSVDASSETS